MIHNSSVVDKKAKVSDNVKIGGESGVVKDIEDNSVVMGYPAIPFKNFIKNWKKK